MWVSHDNHLVLCNPSPPLQSITLTNYSGRERELLKDMIHLTGIPYTGHLSRDTSYLICKRFVSTIISFYAQMESVFCYCSASGKKYEKAVEWGVTIVNASFLADIIHSEPPSHQLAVCPLCLPLPHCVDGQVPAVLFPRHTGIGQPNEFLPSHCFEASRILREPL